MYRYLALESMCLLATSEFSHEAVKKHQETVITALKVSDLQFKTNNFRIRSNVCVFRWNIEEIFGTVDGERCERSAKSRRFIIRDV